MAVLQSLQNTRSQEMVMLVQVDDIAARDWGIPEGSMLKKKQEQVC